MKIVALEEHFATAEVMHRLRMSEVRIGRGACFQAPSSQGQISHGREHDCPYGRHNRQKR